MKLKIFVLILCALAPLAFLSCSGQSESTTAPETVTLPPQTSRKTPEVTEMSPEKIKTAPGISVPLSFSSVDISAFEEIRPEDSMLKNCRAEKILKNGKTEYYFSEDGQKINFLIAGSSGEPEFSGSYNAVNGALEFTGSSDTSWYYNADGSLRCIAYVYAPAGVTSFYTPDGSRDFVIAAGGYCNADLDEISDEEAAPFIEKYADTVEFINANR